MPVPVKAPQLYKKLKGVFAVHKHVGVPLSVLGNTILNKIISDLQTYEQRPQKPMVTFLPPPGSSRQLIGNANAISELSTISEQNLARFQCTPANVDDWFDHPLVQGRRYNPEDFELTFGTTLDVLSSGVQLFGLQTKGRQMLRNLGKLQVPRSYYLYGKLGLATTRHHSDAKVMEKTTWDHVTEAKISRLLCIIQGSYRNTLLRSSNLDLDSQHGYEMASRGLVTPQTPTGPLVLDIKLHKLSLPDFVLDVTCIRESGIFLRKIINDMGRELRSTAVCTKVHRYRDAIFLDEDESTLLTREIKSDKLVKVMAKNTVNLKSFIKGKASVYKFMRNTPPDEMNDHDELGQNDDHDEFNEANYYSEFNDTDDNEFNDESIERSESTLFGKK